MMVFCTVKSSRQTGQVAAGARLRLCRTVDSGSADFPAMRGFEHRFEHFEQAHRRSGLSDSWKMGVLSSLSGLTAAEKPLSSGAAQEKTQGGIAPLGCVGEWKSPATTGCACPEHGLKPCTDARHGVFSAQSRRFFSSFPGISRGDSARFLKPVESGQGGP